MGRKIMKIYTRIDNSVRDNRKYYFLEWGRFRIAYYADRVLRFQWIPKEEWSYKRKEDIKCFSIKL